MNVQGRIVLFVFAGAAAGLLTWFVSDVSGLLRLPDVAGTLRPNQQWQQHVVGMVFGGLVGALLGTAEGVALGSPAQTGRATLVGLLVGTVAGFVGLLLGQGFFGLLYRPASNPLVFIGNVLARAVGWGFIGALAGTADGWRKASFRVGRNGFVGGLIGGLIGGTTFEIVPYLLVGWGRPGIVARLLGFVITGAAIGLFVALAQQLFKEAWVRVMVGKNEGKEYLVDKAETRIGRAELSDIPLFGDPAVARTHALLLARPDGGWVLRDSGSPGGTRINGEPVTRETAVRDNDRIEIGNRMLVFHERLTAKRTQVAPRDRAVPRPRGLSDPPPFGDGAEHNRNKTSAARFETSKGTKQTGLIVPQSEPHLVAVSGPHTGAAFALRAPSRGGTLWVIGRDPDSEIALPSDVKASRVHARLTRQGAGYVIEDAGSTNGTFVNGTRINNTLALVPGDTVLVGDTALRFEQSASAQSR